MLTHQPTKEVYDAQVQLECHAVMAFSVKMFCILENVQSAIDVAADIGARIDQVAGAAATIG